MRKKANQTHGARHGGDQEVPSVPFRDAPPQVQELKEHRERLEALKVCEQEIEALERHRSELEVACIEKDARLKRITPASSIDPSLVAEIADAWYKKRKLHEALTKHAPSGSGRGAATKELERLRMGRDALVEWLDAPNAARPQKIVKFVYLATLAATLVVIWSALFIHPVLLLVLLGLGVVLAFLRSFNQNEAWVRLGAKRHFDATDLEPPSCWEVTAVRERVEQLETKIEAAETPVYRQIEPKPSVEEQQDEQERSEVEFALAEMHLAKLMVEAGLEIDNLGDPVMHWLDAVAEARHARRELERITRKIKAVNGQRDDAQDRLFRFLARQGEAPQGGVVDRASLAAGLERVAGGSSWSTEGKQPSR
jgi:hypothetical protein